MQIHSIMDAVGWLGYCFCGYAVFLVAWTIWKKQRPAHDMLWMNFRANVRKQKKSLREKGRAHSLVISHLVALLCLTLLVSAAVRSRSAIVEEHNVAILGHLYDGDFFYRSDEEKTGGVFRPCASDMHDGVNVDALLTSAIGYVAEKSLWEERGTCKSIFRSELGFWFRDANNNFEYKRVQ